MNKHRNFYTDKPVFGLDIGHGSLKVMQIDSSHPQPRVLGYGTTTFDSTASDDGVILKPELIARSLQDLFNHNMIGDISTSRVVMSIPAYRTFSRSIQLPKLSSKELQEAVSTEIEQYVPVSLDELYYDYHVIDQSGDQIELFASAIPRHIVDSYIVLTKLMGLEVVLLETTMAAAARLLSHDKHSDVATVIIDFGSLTSDISIYHNEVLVTGTVAGGGLVFTKTLEDMLHVTNAEAGVIKTKYGLIASKRQAEIRAALEPTLQKILKEIQRMIRYYDERYGNEQKIGQMVILGGGANMPGLADYFTNALRLPVRTQDPWTLLNYRGLQPPSDPDRLMYATVAGLALVEPRRIFA